MGTRILKKINFILFFTEFYKVLFFLYGLLPIPDFLMESRIVRFFEEILFLPIAILLDNLLFVSKHSCFFIILFMFPSVVFWIELGYFRSLNKIHMSKWENKLIDVFSIISPIMAGLFFMLYIATIF